MLPLKLPVNNASLLPKFCESTTFTFTFLFIRAVVRCGFDANEQIRLRDVQSVRQHHNPSPRGHTRLL